MEKKDVQKNENFKCLIFDFDGTLADTEKFALKIANSLADRYKFKKIAKEELPVLKAMGAREVIKYLDVSRWKIPLIIRAAQKRLIHDIHRVEVINLDWQHVLQELNENLTLGILTSNSLRNVKLFLSANEMEYFDFLVSSSIFGKEKKFRSIIKQYGLQRNEILYVGDEVRDIRAAHEVGIACGVVTWGYNTKEILLAEGPEFVFDHPQDILKVALKGKD